MARSGPEDFAAPAATHLVRDVRHIHENIQAITRVTDATASPAGGSIGRGRGFRLGRGGLQTGRLSQRAGHVQRRRRAQ